MCTTSVLATLVFRNYGWRQQNSIVGYEHRSILVDDRRNGEQQCAGLALCFQHVAARLRGKMGANQLRCGIFLKKMLIFEMMRL